MPTTSCAPHDQRPKTPERADLPSVDPEASRLSTRPLDRGLVRGAELERTERGWFPHRLPARARARCTDPQRSQCEPTRQEGPL